MPGMIRPFTYPCRYRRLEALETRRRVVGQASAIDQHAPRDAVTVPPNVESHPQTLRPAPSLGRCAAMGGSETVRNGGDQPLEPGRSGMKKVATSTSSALASLTMVASDGLRSPRRIWERCPFEKFVSR